MFIVEVELDLVADASEDGAGVVVETILADIDFV